MYERMLNKQEEPTIAQMTAHCGACAELFTRLNEWLSGTFETTQDVTFPYGNGYGWGIAHRKNKKLICHVFAEENAFTVMMRLSDKQFASIYGKVQPGTQDQIDHKYPCGDGGWLHYRIKFNPEGYNPNLFNSIEYLLQSKGRVTVRDICGYSAVSQRQMQRLFKQEFGLSIKRTASLVRYQNVWREVIFQERFNIQKAVGRYGYADQAHLLNEFKRFHGLWPSQAKLETLERR